MKKCSRCLETKPLSSFTTRKKGNGEFRYLSYCKKCNSEHSKRRYRDIRVNNLKCVYRFLDVDGNVLYVGKTENIKARIRKHLSTSGHLSKECYNRLDKIQFIAMKSVVLMDIKELYYINLYKPIFNSNHLIDEASFIISDFSNDIWIDFNDYSVSKFERINDLSGKYVNLMRGCGIEDNIRFVKSVFSRKRNDNYLVYIEYESVSGKVIQSRKGTFKSKEEASEFVKDLKTIYFK